MDPKLLDYMRIMSDQSKAEGNPVEEGTMSGIQASRRSIGMDEAQAARARGMAFMTLGHRMANPGHGSGIRGALSAFNAGALPAAQAYRGEEQQAEAQNTYMWQQAQMEQMRRAKMKQQQTMALVKMAQREQEQATLQAHRADQLNERRGYHQQKLGLDERKLDEKEGIVPGSENMEGIPLKSLSQGAKTAEHKVFNEHQTAIKVNERAIHVLKEMLPIFNQYRDIGDSYFHLMNDKTLLGKIQRNLLPKDKLTAIQKLNKLGNELIFQKIKGMPAKGLNLMLENRIAESVANGNSTYDAANYVINDMIKQAEKANKDSRHYVNSYKKRYIPIPSEIEEPETESQGSEMATPAGQIIKMQTPDGKTWSIPADKVEAAKARGAIEIGK